MRRLLLLASLCLLGCGGRPSGPPAVPVRGSVTLDGTPLREGEIVFTTVSQGRFEILPIVQGTFSGKATVGERRVEIYSFKPGPPLTGPGEGNPAPPINTLPARYSTASELKANVLPTGTNEFEFMLQSR